jgi:hypothetical protein
MEEEHRWTGTRAGWDKRGAGNMRDRTKAAIREFRVDFGLN